MTFVHVLGETVEDVSNWGCIKDLHGAADDLMEELVMELRGSSQRDLRRHNLKFNIQKIKTSDEEDHRKQSSQLEARCCRGTAQGFINTEAVNILCTLK